MMQASKPRPQSKKTIKAFFSKLFERIPELYGIMIVDEQDDLWSKALSPSFTSSAKKSELFNQLLDYTGKSMTEEEKNEEIKTFLSEDKGFDFQMGLVLTFNLSASKMKKLPNFKKEIVAEEPKKKENFLAPGRAPMNLMNAPPMQFGGASSSAVAEEDKSPNNFIITFLKDFILVQFQINLKDDKQPQQKGMNPQQLQMNKAGGPAGSKQHNNKKGKKSKAGGRKGKKGKHNDDDMGDFDDEENGDDDDNGNDKDEEGESDDGNAGNVVEGANAEESLFVTYIGGKDLNVQQLMTLSTPISSMLVSS